MKSAASPFHRLGSLNHSILAPSAIELWLSPDQLPPDLAASVLRPLTQP